MRAYLSRSADDFGAERRVWNSLFFAGEEKAGRMQFMTLLTGEDMSKLQPRERNMELDAKN
jgi:hypothetical protein